MKTRITAPRPQDIMSRKAILKPSGLRFGFSLGLLY
jgi:hypothetical protein